MRLTYLECGCARCSVHLDVPITRPAAVPVPTDDPPCCDCGASKSDRVHSDIYTGHDYAVAVPVPEGERVREAAEDAVASILIQRTSVIGGRTLAADIVDAILPLLQPAAQQNDSVADKTISAQQDALKEVEL